MKILKLAVGAVVTFFLIKIAFWLLGMVAGIFHFLMSIVFLALAVLVVVFIIRSVFRAVNGEQKGTA